MNLARLQKPTFYGQFAPEVDRFAYERYFRHTLLDGVTFECGSFDGVLESSCYFFEQTLGWKAYNVEASPPIFDRLQANRPEAENIHAALSDSEGFIEFAHVVHPVHGQNFGNGSVSHTAAHKAELDATGCTFETYRVPKTTYKALIERLGIRRVDFMVLDIEGHEVAALNGMVGCAVMPAVLCVEVGQVGLDAVQGQIEALGFVFDVVSHVNAFFVRADKWDLFQFIREQDGATVTVQRVYSVPLSNIQQQEVGALLSLDALREEYLHEANELQGAADEHGAGRQGRLAVMSGLAAKVMHTARQWRARLRQ